MRIDLQSQRQRCRWVIGDLSGDSRSAFEGRNGGRFGSPFGGRRRQVAGTSSTIAGSLPSREPVAKRCCGLRPLSPTIGRERSESTAVGGGRKAASLVELVGWQWRRRRVGSRAGGSDLAEEVWLREVGRSGEKGRSGGGGTGRGGAVVEVAVRRKV